MGEGAFSIGVMGLIGVSDNGGTTATAVSPGGGRSGGTSFMLTKTTLGSTGRAGMTGSFRAVSGVGVRSPQSI